MNAILKLIIKLYKQHFKISARIGQLEERINQLEAEQKTINKLLEGMD